MKFKYLPVVLGAAILGITVSANAADQIYTMTMKDGAFNPPSLEVPANQKIHLVVKNENTAQTEFESYPLNQEQKINPGASAEMYLQPLDAGQYPVFDDNDPDTKGMIIAK